MYCTLNTHTHPHSLTLTLTRTLTLTLILTHSEPLLTAKKAREREAKWLKMFKKWTEPYYEKKKLKVIVVSVSIDSHV